MRRLLPHPLQSLLLVLIWAMLWNDFSPGTLASGAVPGLLLPPLLRSWWPDPPRLRRPDVLIAFLGIVLWDIFKSNVAVARAILFRRSEALHSAWIVVPLDLRRPESIALLAGAITLTPGTLSADLSVDGLSLLVHCLDAPDPDATRDEIKRRYETRIRKVFE